MFKHLITGVLALSLVAAAFGAPQAGHQSGKSSPKKNGAAKKTPFKAHAFTCVHCGLRMKAAKVTDLKKACDVCGCEKTNAQCHPAPKTSAKKA